MKVLLAALIVALAIPAVGAAAPSAWVPGSSYYIGEMELADTLEKRFDSAYCDGIARFGKRGSFPYEKYRVFDCTTTLNRDYCSDMRVKTVKDKRQGWYRWSIIRQPDCF